ncbi:imidazole glycerol phosphate synthase subunit HisH [beta proteobacterium MWH-UniP1]
MRRAEVIVIDYGMGNLLSVQRALEHLGARVRVSAEPERIRMAERVVLPGVGAFPDAMEELHRRGLVSVIREIADRGTPLLGICLGMQLLFEKGFEFMEIEGLGLIPGYVVNIPREKHDGTIRKIPHIGWNSLLYSGDNRMLTDLRVGDSVYFVHSYMAQPVAEGDQIAHCFYDGISIPAVVLKENVVGCQFHPEKSGPVGLQILKNFISEKSATAAQRTDHWAL